MKKVFFSSILLLLFVPSFAQSTIKWFNGKTPEEIIARFGEPQEKDLSGIERSEYQVDYALFYEHFSLGLNKYSQNNSATYIEYFETDSSDFIILDDVIDGGLRVGGSIQKLKTINFSATPYGKNKPENDLRPMPISCGFAECPESYCIYSEEYNYKGIEVQNGIIRSWGFYSKEDIPYPDAKPLIY